MLVPEAVAPAVTLGAVYCAARFAPHRMEALRNLIATNIVLPHLGWCESLGGSLRHAHERYDRERREENLKRGEPVHEVQQQSSPQERATVIADTLLKTALALTSDLVGTYALQHLFNHQLHAGIPVGRTAIIESSVHLGGIMMMPTLFAIPAEDLHHGISKIMCKVFGMRKERADDIGVAFSYVVLPGQVAALVSLAAAQGHVNGRIQSS